MTETHITTEAVWEALEEVKDPEVPVVSVVEMGIVRDVQLMETDTGRAVHIIMTPTFSGCPALDVMRRDMEARVRRMGVRDVTVETVLFPPWSTDFITDEARQKLKEFGLAPPGRHGGNLTITFYEPVACPYCDSMNTSIRNTFGSTLCRAIYYCNACRQPFEQFKAL